MAVAAAVEASAAEELEAEVAAGSVVAALAVDSVADEAEASDFQNKKMLFFFSCFVPFFVWQS